MPICTLDAKQFEDSLQKNELVFIDFWAEWCSPCKQFALVYERLAKAHPDLYFAKVNVEEEAELADELQIRSIPHLMIFKRGILIYSEAGSMPESTLKDLVQQAITVNVDEIRKQLDEEAKR